MHPLFLPRLVNGVFEDPALFIPFQFERRALLFDLGDTTRLSPRDILKITHVFVSHTHMDHFVGFDRLLRFFLGRGRRLFLYGPQGFHRHVEGKLAGYAWDLVERYTNPLRLVAIEVHPDQTQMRAYHCSERFAPRDPPQTRPFDGSLLREAAFEVFGVVLQHSLPCLGFAIQERFHVNILKTELQALGLAPGPWLTRFKRALYEGADPAAEIALDAAGRGGRRFTVGELATKIARITPGQKIVYITDVGDTPSNREAIVEFARDADQLFIEAAFLQQDAERPAARHHLTARQAGEMAAIAGAKQLRLFHFSPRYEGREQMLVAEAQQAYEKGLAR